MYQCKFGGDPPTGSEDRAQKRLIFTVFSFITTFTLIHGKENWRTSVVCFVIQGK